MLRFTPAFLHTPFILSAYRVYFTPRLALASLFRWHNETVNAWSHLLAALAFAAMAVATLAGELPHSGHRGAQLQLGDGSDPHRRSAAVASLVDYLLLGLFYSSAVACFACSGLYHLFGCCSYDAHQCLYRCDIGGILLLILGSYLPALKFAFTCRPLLQGLYCGVITALVLALLLAFNLPRCSSRRWHCVRVTAMVATIAFAVLPTAHWLIAVRPADYPQLSLATYLLPLLLMLACYAVGFGFYASKLPERLSPGRFDLVLQSHNWWHLFIVAAAAVWESELKLMFARTASATCN